MTALGIACLHEHMVPVPNSYSLAKGRHGLVLARADFDDNGLYTGFAAFTLRPSAYGSFAPCYSSSAWRECGQFHSTMPR
jgi:hypothetical protein